MTVSLGTTLKGRYRLDAVLGKGGMGEVYAATDATTGEDVAIKVVSRAYFTDTLMARLYREAEAARRIQSDLVPRLYEVDHTEQGELFLVMERLHGEPLSRRLKMRGALDWSEVSAYGEDMLRALIDAHTAAIVHRDLKPGNVFMTEPTPGSAGEGGRERAKILDFGVCKIDGTDEENLTATGEAIGTIAYMAPEQIRGAAKVDERADLYSLGLVVFEMVSGRLPFDAQGQVALIASKLERSARKLGELAVVPVPAGLEALLAKALARKPQDRFQSAQEMLRAWRALGPAVVAPRAHPSTGPTFPSGTQTAMTAGTLTREAGGGSTRLWLMLAAVAALLGASGLIAAVVARNRAAREEAAAAAVAAPVVSA
ncbi:MAG: serine/threonine protein kinase, partial [Myxococcales bacterium]|nr:serine/threonine protein kinase [Myxococcales bacterium]